MPKICNSLRMPLNASTIFSRNLREKISVNENLTKNILNIMIGSFLLGLMGFVGKKVLSFISKRKQHRLLSVLSRFPLFYILIAEFIKQERAKIMRNMIKRAFERKLEDIRREEINKEEIKKENRKQELYLQQVQTENAIWVFNSADMSCHLA